MIIDETATVAEIIALERTALDRWGLGDPGGYLEIYAETITYFDPVIAARIDGLPAMTEYYRPWIGQIRVDRYDMINPQVVAAGGMAVLTYNLVNYVRHTDGAERVTSRWNSTAVYRRAAFGWRIEHSHWSYTLPELATSATADATTDA
jgi:ketosteroid isomerase-like protein